jgi:Na+(H+)/acetate symporter ActP
MRVTRLVALLCGAGGALLAIYLKTVVAALTIFYTLLTAALLLPIVAGLYLSRVNARSALLSILVSTGLTLVLELANRPNWTGWTLAGGVPATPLVWGVLAGGLVMLIFSRRQD